MIAATLSLNLLALALPLVMLQVFDRVIPHQSYETLTFLFIGLCVVAFLEFSLKWARIILLGTSGETFEVDVTSKFMDRTLNADPNAIQQETLAAHLDRYDAISKLRAFYGGQGRILAVDLPFTAVFIAMIGLIGGWLILVPLASIALLLGFRIFLKRAQTQIFNQRKSLDHRRHSFLFEVLSQVRTIKLYTMEAQMLRRYELLQEQSVNISHAMIHFSGFSQTFGALFSQAAVAAMGLFGGYLIVQEHIGIAELAACMLLNGRTVQPLLKALNLWVQSENLAASHEKVETACRIAQHAAGKSETTILNGRLKLEEVQLDTSGDKDAAAGLITAEFAQGQFVSVHGADGWRKTQLLKAILAEHDPVSGKLFIDGHLVGDLANVRGRGGIGYADQYGVPFSGSVLDNLSAFGDGDAINRALMLSQDLGIEEIIHRLPLGYNTLLQNSSELSNNPTVIQRICIARALVLEPKVLLLNNVSSSLDETSRQALASVLETLKGTTTVVYAGGDPALLALMDSQIDLSTDADKDEWPEQFANPTKDHVILFDEPKVA